MYVYSAILHPRCRILFYIASQNREEKILSSTKQCSVSFMKNTETQVLNITEFCLV